MITLDIKDEMLSTLSASVLYSVSNHVAGVPGMLACLQEYHMCGENQAVKYRPFASIHVLLLVAGLSDLIVFTFTCSAGHPMSQGT